MIFKSISNATFEVTGFFALYKECIPRVLKILLTILPPLDHHIEAMCVFPHKLHSGSNTWVFSPHYQNAQPPFHHLKSRANTELHNHSVTVVKRICKIICKLMCVKINLYPSHMISHLVSFSPYSLYY